MKFLRSIGSLMLAILVIAASSNFFVGVHVCGNAVKAVSFLSEADGCGHADLPPCHRAMMKGCCDNIQIDHAAQDIKKEVASTLVPSATAITLEHVTVVLAELVPTRSIVTSERPPYDPLLLPTVDRSVLHAVFLI